MHTIFELTVTRCCHTIAAETAALEDKMRSFLYAVSALLMILMLFASPQVKADKSYTHPSIDFKITFMPDGSAEIEETRAFRFDGSFSWAFIEKGTRGKYGSYGVEFLGVWDADSNEQLRYETYEKGGYEGVKWHYSARNTTREFLIKYRITGAIQRYTDAAQFYWKIVGESHAYIRSITADLTPPEPSPYLFKIFVHTQAPPGSLNFAEDFSSARVELSGVPRNDFVELRVLMDPDVFPDAPLLSGESHGSLLEDERIITEQWREAEQNRIESYARSQRMIKFSVIAGIILILALVALYIWFFLKFGKEPDTGYDHDYEREPPRDLPPCILPAILTQSGIHDTEMGKSFSSALIESARLGYIEIRETEKKVLLFKSKGLEYTLKDKGKELLSGSYEPAGDERPLIPFEKDILKTVFIEAGKGDRVSSHDIEEWAKKTTGMKTNFKAFMDSHKKRLRDDFEKEYFSLDDPASEKARKIFIAISFGFGLLFVVLFLVGLRSPVLFVFAPLVIILGVLLSIPLARRTREAALEYERWKSFKRFMSDFSAMKDAGPSLLPLWEHYLVYAVALGVADKLINNLKLVAMEYKTPVPMAAWFYPMHASSFGPGGVGEGLSSLDAMTASLSNLESLSSAMTTSTSSGGGFSGGGGGGGGGGGSGAG